MRSDGLDERRALVGIGEGRGLGGVVDSGERRQGQLVVDGGVDEGDGGGHPREALESIVEIGIGGGGAARIDEALAEGAQGFEMFDSGRGIGTLLWFKLERLGRGWVARGQGG